MALGKSLIYNSLNRLLNTVVIFLTMVLLTRTIGASDFGVLTLMIANASILNLISSLGISSGITYNLAAKNLSENNILSITSFMLIAQFFFIFIFEIGWHLIGNSFWLFKGYSLTDLLLGICFFISISAIEKYAALFYGKQQYSLANKIALITNSTLFFILLSFSQYNFQSNYIFFVIYVLGNLFQASALVICYHITYKNSITIEAFNKQQLNLFFSYSFLAFITNLLQFVAYRADYWIVDYYKGTTELGIYSVSVKLAQLFWIIPNLIAAIIFPKVAAKETEGNHLSFSFLIRLLNTLNILAGFIMLVFSSDFISRIFGVEYSRSVTPFQILLPGVIAYCITTVLAGYYAGINKLKVNFWGTVLCLLIILILDLVFIPRFGIKGAAIASSIGYTLSTFYSIFVFKQLTKVGLDQLLLLNKGDLVNLRGLLGNYIKSNY